MRGLLRSGLLLGAGIGLMLAGFLLWGKDAIHDATQVITPPAVGTAQRTAGAAPVTTPTPGTGTTAPVTAAAKPDAGTTTPASPTGDPVKVDVNPGESFEAVAHRLADAGLIADPAAFLQKVEDQKLDTQLQIGNYSFKKGTPEAEILKTLTTATE